MRPGARPGFCLPAQLHASAWVPVVGQCSCFSDDCVARGPGTTLIAVGCDGVETVGAKFSHFAQHATDLRRGAGKSVSGVSRFRQNVDTHPGSRRIRPARRVAVDRLLPGHGFSTACDWLLAVAHPRQPIGSPSAAIGRCCRRRIGRRAGIWPVRAGPVRRYGFGMVADARVSLWNGAGSGFAVHTAALPQDLRSGEVLVALGLATICGSDVKTVTGRRPGPAPCVLGHEQVGTVVDVGPDAAVAVGQRVVWSVTASCGRCTRCVRTPQKCLSVKKYGHEPFDVARPLTGGLATHCLLYPGTAVVVVPAGVPDEVAAPASCATATVAAVLAAAGSLRPGMRALVTGAGMLGIAATAMLAQLGVDVIVYDPDRARRERALLFGAAAVTGDRFAGADVAFELSGRADAVQISLDALTIGGTLVLAGSVSPGHSIALDPERVVRNLLTVTGVHNYRPADLQAAVRFLATHQDRYPFADLAGGRWPLERLGEAFQAARAGTFARQCVRPES
jgi:putative phosphonate catabolism associated alcohol dehydrogenase